MSHVSIHGRGSLLLTANHESLLGSMGGGGTTPSVYQCFLYIFELTTKRKEGTGYVELSLAITFGGCTIVVVHYFPQAGCYLAVMPSFGMQRVVGKHDIPRYIAVCWPVMLAGFLFPLVLLLLLLRRLVWLSVLGMLCCCCRHRSRSSGVRNSSSRSATPLAAAAAAT